MAVCVARQKWLCVCGSSKCKIFNIDRSTITIHETKQLKSGRNCGFDGNHMNTEYAVSEHLRRMQYTFTSTVSIQPSNESLNAIWLFRSLSRHTRYARRSTKMYVPTEQIIYYLLLNWLSKRNEFENGTKITKNVAKSVGQSKASANETILRQYVQVTIAKRFALRCQFLTFKWHIKCLLKYSCLIAPPTNLSIFSRQIITCSNVR